MAKPILCLDFDGVLHSYISGWQGADVIPDPPVPGAIDFIVSAHRHFTIVIHSSRLTPDTYDHPEGIHVPAYHAIADWLVKHGIAEGYLMAARSRFDFERAAESNAIAISSVKPPAFVTIDDRAITFTGTWPEPAELLKFQTWCKKPV